MSLVMNTTYRAMIQSQVNMISRACIYTISGNNILSREHTICGKYDLVSIIFARTLERELGNALGTDSKQLLGKRWLGVDMQGVWALIQ